MRCSRNCGLRRCGIYPIVCINLPQMKLQLIRDVRGTNYTLGKLFADGVYVCETCEDTDRKMEAGGEKVYAKTAIPLGTYKVSVSFSQRFKKPLPLIHDVPGFTGIRMHGGNGPDDTEGCILVGKVRMARGIANCAATLQRIIDMIDDAEEAGEVVTLEVS